MEVKWGDKMYIEVGRCPFPSFAPARAEADLLEERLDLSCVVERMPKNSFKIFCRGAGYHEIKEVKK
jgi:hypothetical protein